MCENVVTIKASNLSLVPTFLLPRQEKTLKLSIQLELKTRAKEREFAYAAINLLNI